MVAKISQRRDEANTYMSDGTCLTPLRVVVRASLENRFTLKKEASRKIKSITTIIVPLLI